VTFQGQCPPLGRLRHALSLIRWICEAKEWLRFPNSYASLASSSQSGPPCPTMTYSFTRRPWRGSKFLPSPSARWIVAISYFSRGAKGIMGEQLIEDLDGGDAGSHGVQRGCKFVLTLPVQLRVRAHGERCHRKKCGVDK
jgi:hypothetical protein